MLIGVGALFVIAAAAGPSQPATINTTNTSGKSNNTQTQHKSVTTTKEVTTTEPIPFTSSTVNDASLAKGTTKVRTAGVNGVKTLTYTVTYKDGKETGRTLKSTVVTTPPVNQVTAVGTYVAPPQPSCPNGSYVNSAGNTVCSPAYSNTVPPGATARCVDGTYSYSQSHSGTCSHHGGVAEWL